VADGPLSHVLHQVQQIVAEVGGAGPPDHDLLGRFLHGRDEAAFAALVRRHGPMVLGVCRRVLKHAHDAEDACQATFLVLARRAACIRQRQAVGSWLHGVAYRVARKLQATVARRAAREGALGEPEQADTTAEVTWREVRLVLDEELARLPEKYRAPLVLCYLEGMTQDEAARQLGWAHGVLRGRLDRGRDRLRARLARRGLSLSAALLGAALAETGAPAAVRAALVVATVRAALPGAAGVVSAEVAALAEEVSTAMFSIQLKTVTLGLLAFAVAASLSAALGYRALAGQQVPPEPSSPPAQDRPAALADEVKAKPDAADEGPVRVIKDFKEVGKVIEPEDTLEVGVKQTKLLVLKDAPVRVLMSGGDKWAAWTNISPRQLSLSGVQLGTATWYLWFRDPAGGKEEQILAVRVRVLDKGDRGGEKPQRSKRFRQFVPQVIVPQDVFTLQQGECRVLVLKEAPFRMFVTDEGIADYNVVNDPKVLNLEAKKPGTTVMTFWLGNKDDIARQSVYTFLVHVKP
jgi:RNA polymerase sigma factor (sigma-70 family)